MGTMVIGRSGWVRYQAADLPGVAYLRFCRNARERWTLREVFVDGMKAELTATTMSRIPFVVLEAMVNSPEYEAQMRSRSVKSSAAGGPGDGSNLAVLASRMGDQYFNTDPTEHWVAMAYWAEIAVEARGAGKPLEHEVPRVPRRRVHTPPASTPSDYRLTRLPGPDGLTDAFLDDVARAYAAAVERNEPPNKTLAADSGAPPRTVERWVYTARARKRMPQARNGARG